MTTLKEFLESQKLKGNFLLLTVVKEIDEGQYIVGDKSCLGVLDLKKNGKSLKIGTGIKVIKPMHVNEYTLQSHPHFFPSKSLENEAIIPDKKQICLLERKTKSSNESMKNESIKNEKHLTIEDITRMSSSATIPDFNFLVISISKIIQTASGQYQICGLKDINGMKISINLYEKFLNTLEIGKVFGIQKIRKFNIKKEGKLVIRLQTTKNSVITKAPKSIETVFKQVTIADQSVEGIIIGFTNISCYYSCSKHWNTIDEQGVCYPCGQKPDEANFDFKVELLLQPEENKEEIKNYLVFKRVATMITIEDEEEAVENKLLEYEGKRCTIEHDDADNDERPVIAKRMLVNL